MIGQKVAVVVVGKGRFGTCLAAFALILILTAPGGRAGAVGPEAPALTAVATDPEAETALSLGDLRALPWTTIATRTPFNDGVVAYRGPLMRDVLHALGLSDAASVFCLAVNDYSVEIPTRDFHDWDVILAMEADGAPLPPRETGPLWIIYPVSDHPELGGRVYSERLIWQLIRIEAR